jgi:hypothetical protein
MCKVEVMSGRGLSYDLPEAVRFSSNERHLKDNIFQIQHDLTTLQYQHDPYSHFYVSDPKQRHISKASVKDRLVPSSGSQCTD